MKVSVSVLSLIFAAAFPLIGALPAALPPTRVVKGDILGDDGIQGGGAVTGTGSLFLGGSGKEDCGCKSTSTPTPTTTPCTTAPHDTPTPPPATSTPGNGGGNGGKSTTTVTITCKNQIDLAPFAPGSLTRFLPYSGGTFPDW